MRRGAHAPTVGILLCTGRNEAIVRYALSGAGAPVAVATYDTLPPDQRAGLPDPGQLTAALTDALTTSDDDHDGSDETPAAPVASPPA